MQRLQIAGLNFNIEAADDGQPKLVFWRESAAESGQPEVVIQGEEYERMCMQPVPCEHLCATGVKDGECTHADVVPPITLPGLHGATRLTRTESWKVWYAYQGAKQAIAAYADWQETVWRSKCFQQQVLAAAFECLAEVVEGWNDADDDRGRSNDAFCLVVFEDGSGAFGNGAQLVLPHDFASLDGLVGQLWPWLKDTKTLESLRRLLSQCDNGRSDGAPAV